MLTVWLGFRHKTHHIVQVVEEMFGLIIPILLPQTRLQMVQASSKQHQVWFLKHGWIKVPTSHQKYTVSLPKHWRHRLKNIWFYCHKRDSKRL